MPSARVPTVPCRLSLWSTRSRSSTSTIKVIDEKRNVVSTPNRRELVAVQTPQAFRARALRIAHAKNPEGTDDATLLESHGFKVVVVDGDALNRKITTPDDLNWARAISRGEV